MKEGYKMTMTQPQINDLNIYNLRMQKGMEDKLWFLPFLNTKSVIDYGCANGILLSHLHEFNPDLNLIGVDISPEMLKIANYNVPSASLYTTNEFFNQNHDKNSTIVLSSVIHEIYSYDQDPDQTIKKILDLDCDQIAIRDMFVSSNTRSKLISAHDHFNFQLYVNPKQLADYEEVWGPIIHQDQMIHFLLKYKYVENWDREVRENYFPIDLEEFEKIVSDKYEIVYKDHYVLPFIHDQIQKDFKIDLKDPTHCKLLLKKKM